MSQTFAILRKTPLTGIELSEFDCRVAQLTRASSGVVVTASFVVPFGPLPADPAARVRAKAEALRAALRERKLRIRQARLCVSKSHVTTRYRQLPPADSEAELEQMAHIEAERHIPFNVERHQVDYQVMAREELAGSHVLIVAVDLPVIEEAIAICEQAGIDLAAADVSSAALYRLARMRVLPAKPAAGAPEEKTTTAVVHLGDWNADIILIANGLLVFARNTNLSPRALARAADGQSADIQQLSDIDALRGDGPAPAATADEAAPAGEGAPVAVGPWLSRLAQEIRRTHHFATREFNCGPISEILVSGAGLAIRNIDEYLRINLDVAVRPLIDRTSTAIAIAPRTDFGAQTLDAAALAIGAALDDGRGHDKRVNLLPAEFLRRRQRRKRFVSLGATVALAVVALSLSLLYFSRQQAGLRARLERHESLVAGSQQRVREIERMEKEMALFDDLFRNPRKHPLDMLDYVCGLPIVQKQVRLIQFKFTRDKELRLFGHALQFRDVTDFEANLKQSGFFTNVSRVTQQPYPLSHGREVYAFEIACQLAPPKTKEQAGERLGGETKGLDE